MSALPCGVSYCPNSQYVHPNGWTTEQFCKQHLDERTAQAALRAVPTSGAAAEARSLAGRAVPVADPRTLYLEEKVRSGDPIRFDRSGIPKERVKGDKMDSDYDKTAFLGNFDPVPVVAGGRKFECREALYQFAKFRPIALDYFTTGVTQAKERSSDNPNAAGEQAWQWGQKPERGGLKLACRPDFDDVRVQIMANILIAHYRQHPELEALLRATENAQLVEWSHHGDQFWGIDAKSGSATFGTGKNQLGRLHMAIREAVARGHDLRDLRVQSLEEMLMMQQRKEEPLDAELAVFKAIKNLSEPASTAPAAASVEGVSAAASRVSAAPIEAMIPPPVVAQPAPAAAPRAPARPVSFFSSLTELISSLFRAVIRFFSRLFSYRPAQTQEQRRLQP